MKKVIKKPIAMLLALVIIMTSLLVSPMSASAASSPQSMEKSNIAIWADAENVLSQEKIDAYATNSNSSVIPDTIGGVKPFRKASSGNYYWFFPSNADLSQLRIWYQSGKSLTIGGRAVASGETTDAFASINQGGTTMNVTVNFNGSNYTVTAMKSGDVGTVYIDTTSGSLSKINVDNHTGSDTGTIMVVQPDGTVDYMGEMTKMSGRGNGTWNKSNVKNPYNVKLAASTSLLGMGAAKKWVLLANVNDDTLIKNQLSYDFAKYIGIKYQPTCKPVDLYVNEQYLGSYQLAEKVEIKSNRINLKADAYESLELANPVQDPVTGLWVPGDLSNTSSKLTLAGGTVTTKTVAPATPGSRAVASKSLNNPSDITGGYLYELEISNRWIEESAAFCAYNRQGWVLKSCDIATNEMVEYSYQLLHALGGAVYNGGVVPNKQITTSYKPKYTSTTTINPAPAKQYQNKRWSELLDADSAVRYYWTQEYFKNMDSSTSSTYFYKDADVNDPMLYAGPMWDMDNSIGFDRTGSDTSRWGYSWASADGWYTKKARMYRFVSSDAGMSYDSDSKVPLNFYAALASNCSDFWEMAEIYWYNLIEPATKILLGEEVDEKGILKSTQEYMTTVSKSGAMNAQRLDVTYSSNYTGMNNWFSTRNTWIDGQIPRTDISTSELFVENISQQAYTGSPITPSPVVQIRKPGSNPENLIENQDYVITYENNINAGTATATITGIGVYTGSVEKTFQIVASQLSSATATISPSSYVDTALRVDVTKGESNITSGVTYQWKRNGDPISGATGDTYTTTSEDAGKQITVTVTGDGVNLSGSVTSNICEVSSGSKPQGYSRTIASWDYDYAVAPNALNTADETGLTYYYRATGGENQATSDLYASVDAEENAKIKWSGADSYTNPSVTNGEGQSPVMKTSKNDGLAWGIFPYFETVVSTTGYENIKFSAKLGGTKKAPRDWLVSYSLDGEDYYEIESSVYSITDGKAMEQAFENVELPAICDNQRVVYIRAEACEDIAINNVNTIVNQPNGDASINNIAVTGSSIEVITALEAPTITGSAVQFDNTGVVLEDNNGGADMYYSINGSEAVLYTGPIYPFNGKTAKFGDTVQISAYAKFEDVTSSATAQTFTFGGVDINDFSYESNTTEIANGAVSSTGGVYDKSGKMTAYTDGKSQFVPLWRNSNKSFAVSPDDGAKWSDKSGFTYKVSTAGYENVRFTCDAYTTAQGPKSVTLQYSLDGTTFYNIQNNVTLPANGALESLITTAQLPAACDNKTVVYIRLATTENLTNGGDTLHNNNSKGNLYVNNVVISGEDDGSYKMPYTNKSTMYFGDSGTVKYVSPDGISMNYIVLDSDNDVVMAGAYPEGGIKLSDANGFDPSIKEPYTVLIQAEEDENVSLTNTATYYYKGSTVVKFNYNSSTFTQNVGAEGGTSVPNTGGANAGTLSMCPDGSTPTNLTYDSKYGIKASNSADNAFTATKNLDKPKNNGYWLVETSSKGFRHLTLNLEQIGSDKGPRDWGVAYSLDGTNYTYVENSNVRTLSKDFIADTVETYGNLTLPSACDNRETLYIKIFINGGETIDGTELELVTTGNTGLNKLEISGVPSLVDVTVNVTALETPTATEGTIGVDGADIYIGTRLVGTTDNNGQAVIGVPYNKKTTVTLGGNDGIVARDVTVKTKVETSIGAPVLMFDVYNDGYINIKDYVLMNKNSKYDDVKEYMVNFINVKTSEFTYEEPQGE